MSNAYATGISKADVAELAKLLFKDFCIRCQIMVTHYTEVG